jgi:hypothetical protein
MNLPILPCVITWSPRAGGGSFHTRKKNSKGEWVHYLSISKGYDAANCPQWALDGVVYHEYLHALIPPHLGSTGKRIVHGKEFKTREKLYPHYEQWIQWHKEVLPGNVRKLKKGIKPRVKPKKRTGK